jgi:DNA modification methylase
MKLIQVPANCPDSYSSQPPIPETARCSIQAETPGVSESAALQKIDCIDTDLKVRFAAKMRTENQLDRRVVSFQANKSKAVYRWYKYKEGFSAGLVEFLLRVSGNKSGTVLDPFAGSGTALFAASNLGLSAEGVELLPIGQKIIATRQLIEAGLTAQQVKTLEHWAQSAPWRTGNQCRPLPELRITAGAYPEETKHEIEAFMGALQTQSPTVAAILEFALLCILESVSFTRKDGQYLRWDYRSNRRQGQKPFNKGEILAFPDAMAAKISDIVSDLSQAAPSTDLFSRTGVSGTVKLHHGSCLDIMPQLPPVSFDAIITSPPYCNRYDYTRTYALEIAMLGINEHQLSALRQSMLTCTVENKLKSLLAINPRWSAAIDVADKQDLLQAILLYLDSQKAMGQLNNNGIPRMVRGYFYEMACVIYECARVLKPGARVMMVNDNVRYAGASISVDLILSAMAENMGLRVEQIMVLPIGKGNSSQQMGQHGRDELRKCIYLWQKE